MEKLKKIFNVTYKGKDRKPRTDKSPISEYRWFIKLCSQRGIPRRIILDAILENDDRFKDYNLLAFNLYCSRMFKIEPIEDKKSSKSLINRGGVARRVIASLLVACLPLFGGSCDYESNCDSYLELSPFQQTNYATEYQCIKHKPNFMRDDGFHTNSNVTTVDSEGTPDGGYNEFGYRTDILNASYNLEKGKILDTQIGHDNNFNGLNAQMRYDSARRSVFYMQQIIQKERFFNHYTNSGLKAKITKF